MITCIEILAAQAILIRLSDITSPYLTGTSPVPPRSCPSACLGSLFRVKPTQVSGKSQRSADVSEFRMLNGCDRPISHRIISVQGVLFPGLS